MSVGHEPVDGFREVCHDILQPVAGVLALAGAALVEADLPAGVRSRLEQIVELAEWQSDVVENWLEAAAGDAAPVADRTDAVQVVNAAAAAERLIWAGNLTLIWPPEPVVIQMSPVILRRMTANLLDNATRAAGPSGTVTVEVTRCDSRMMLTVEDDGPGFGSSIRGEGLAKGHGLGLSAVARQTIQREGRLETGRSSLGGGRVSLWLPLAAPLGERSGKPRSSPNGPRWQSPRPVRF
jgi:K+-sensing histidine kinase KdpD